MNYIVTGNDEYLINQQIKQIVSEFLPVDDEMNEIYYDSLILNWQSVIEDAGTFSFFGDRKVIIIENCWFLSARESLTVELEQMLIDYLQNPNPATVMIFSLCGTLDGRKTLTKSIRKLTQVIEIPALSDESFAQIVSKDLKVADVKISGACLNELLNRLPVEMRNWKNELEKLIMYPHTITMETIDQLISRDIEDEVYELTKAVLNNSLGESLQIFRDLSLKEGASITLAALLAEKMRFIYQVKIWAEKGFSNEEIAREFGNIKPGRIYYAKKEGANCSKELLLEMLYDIAVLDYRLKSVDCDPKLEFELLLVNLLGKKNAFS